MRDRLTLEKASESVQFSRAGIVLPLRMQWYPVGTLFGFATRQMPVIGRFLSSMDAASLSIVFSSVLTVPFEFVGCCDENNDVGNENMKLDIEATLVLFMC